ncbi:MAG: MaoC family dehydratase [Phyllobacteriaceae bacterium]|nr:MaoC family dehydratase [Phyllobacteriaceae bacterium]
MSIYKKPPVPLDGLADHIGKEIGVSDWRTVTQEMIDKFAEATDDHQFIHVDPERARDTQFGGTIAHGFLTLSLFSTLAYEAVPPLAGTALGVNVGFDKVRFVNPVKSGARVRARFIFADVNIRPSGYVQVAYDVAIEIEGQTRPALTARWLTLSVMQKAGDAS